MGETGDREWRGTSRGGSFGHRFFILLIRFTGIQSAYLFLCLVVPYFIPFAPAATRSVWKYARHILKYSRFKSFLFLFRNYYSLGKSLIDRVAIQSGLKDRYTFEFGDNYNDFLKVLNRDEGVVMIGAHTGNWETGAPFFDSYGKKINIVMYDAEYRQIRKVIEKEKKQKDYKVIPVNDDFFTYMLKIRNALAEKEYVCFQGDRFLPGNPVIRKTFMGKEADFPAGPFLVATRMQMPVVFYYAMREKGMRYSFHFTIASPVRRNPENKMEEQLIEQYIQSLQKVVEKYPEQWYNYYDFWK